MRISDWSSDVCSSDLSAPGRCKAVVPRRKAVGGPRRAMRQRPVKRDEQRARLQQGRSGRQRPRKFRAAGNGLFRRQRSGAEGHAGAPAAQRSEEHTSELQSLMRISYAVFCLKKKKNRRNRTKIKLAQLLEN